MPGGPDRGGRNMSGPVDLLVAGAGPTGCVLAERAASALGWRVLVVERRNHVGGNCHDPLHANGVRIHRYGPHHFHTDSARVVGYLSRFTAWIPAAYRVKTLVGGELLPFPVNLETMERFFGRAFTPRSARAFLDERRIPCGVPRNSEEYLLARVGREIYEAFYLRYTITQWGRHPRLLDAGVCGRVPIRFNRDRRCVNGSFQRMPRDGYGVLFERMLDHPRIEVRLGCSYEDVRARARPARATVFCGPLDEYFGWKHGRLPWRSLRFRFVEKACEFAQPCVQINYPDGRSCTRSVETKHVTGQRHPRTVVAYEYPCAGGEPYYPVPGPESGELAAVYRSLARRAAREERVFLAGRLGRYEYLDIDDAVLDALRLFDRTIARLAAR